MTAWRMAVQSGFNENEDRAEAEHIIFCITSTASTTWPLQPHRTTLLSLSLDLTCHRCLFHLVCYLAAYIVNIMASVAPRPLNPATDTDLPCRASLPCRYFKTTPPRSGPKMRAW